MHVARRPPLRSGARRLFAHARGAQGRRRKTDPVAAAHHGNEKDLRSRISKARSRFHATQRIGGQAVFPLFQPLAAALPHDPARRIRGQKHQRRVGRLPADARSRFRRAARQARRARGRRQHDRCLLRRQWRRGSLGGAGNRRLFRWLVFQFRGRRHSHAAADALARPHQAGDREQRDGSRDGYVHHVAEIRRLRAAARPHHRRGRPESVLSRQAAKLEPRRVHGLAQRRAARDQMEGLQDQLQAPAALPRPGTAARLCPHHPSPGGPERTRAREPALRALVGDAARAPRRPGVRGKQKERRAHPDRIAARFRAEAVRADLRLDRRTTMSARLLRDGKTSTALSNRESMIWIPGGSFRMGSNDFYREERPVRAETVQGFWIDRYPVTNADFRKFVDATGYVTTCERPPDPAMYPDADPSLLVPGSSVFRKPRGPVDLRDNRAWWEYVPGADWQHPQGPGSSIEGRDDHPVVHVAYEDACAYAAWAGKELPVESEWEFAARGGIDGATYAWGE